MRIIHLLSIAALASLASATTSRKAETTGKKSTVKAVTSEIKPSSKSVKPIANSTIGRPPKALRTAKAGENRGKRTLYDFGNTAYLYPQIAARRAGYDPEARLASSTQSGYYNGLNAIAQFPSDYNLNYSPYPQYLEAPEPIIEIIIKDANETLPETNTQPIVRKTKKKKEKVHVFYVNYKKDQNNKLHLESPIASLNNDETEEEDDEEEEVTHYTATSSPPVKSTTLRTIIHPDSEKYHSNSGIHVTFGSEDKSQANLQEEDAESVQHQVVALPVPQASTKPQHQLNARNDFHGEARSPFTSSFFQSPTPWQYQTQQQQKLSTSQQQLPYQHVGSLFKPHAQSNSPQKQFPPQQPQPHATQQYSSNYYQKQPFHQQTSQQKPQYASNPPPSVPALAQQSQRKPFSQTHQQSQYYVNHNQLYQTQSQQQQQKYNNHQQVGAQQNQYHNTAPHKPIQAPKPPVIFPTAPSKTQDLPVRHAPQPYQPIKFRPTPASAPQPTKSSAIATKLENAQYSPQPYQFQKQPQFIQHPIFTVTAPVPQNYNSQIQSQQPTPQHHQYQTQAQAQTQTQTATQTQKQNQHQYQSQFHTQTHHSPISNAPQANSIYHPQNKTPQQQQQQQTQVPHNNVYQAQSSNPQPSATHPHTNLNWLDIQPSKETELLKSIPKFEQHITETVQNQYSSNQYQSQNQVMHDIPAPNLAAAQHLQQQQHQQHPQSQALLGHYITAAPFNDRQQHGHAQQQQTFTNFVTPSSNLQHVTQLDSTTQAPRFGESTDGQKIMIVTPMPPNVYEQYQAAQSYQSSQSSSGNQEHSTQIINSVQPSQQQYSNYYQQPRQGQPEAPSQSSISASNSPYSVSNYHSDVFKELEHRNTPTKDSQQFHLHSTTTTKPPSTTSTPSTTVNPKTLLQLPEEVPDDLRQHLLSSGILGNADISVLDYDKVGDIALENLPAEHLQHFYGAGGGAQVSESKKVLSVLKANGDTVSLDEKEIERVKEANAVPHRKDTDVKIVRFDGYNSEGSHASSTSSERQYNRYLPLKIDGSNFPKPDSDALLGKYLQSVVVLAPVDTQTGPDGTVVEDSKEVKFLGGDLIKTLVKKPTKEHFKKWLDKEARTDVEQQSVVLLVAKSSDYSEQEIFMYDITTGAVNKLNGELSSKFVSVAEENASTEDLQHGSTLDPNFMEAVMQSPSN